MLPPSGGFASTMSEYSRPYANEHLASLGVGKENLQNRTTRQVLATTVFLQDCASLLALTFRYADLNAPASCKLLLYNSSHQHGGGSQIAPIAYRQLTRKYQKYAITYSRRLAIQDISRTEVFVNVADYGLIANQSRWTGEQWSSAILRPTGFVVVCKGRNSLIY